MTIELRVLRPSEWDEWYQGLTLAFGGIPQSPEKAALIREITDFDRSLAAWDGAECVGSAGSFGMQVTVPGGGLAPMAGVTMVSVSSTHRRRGVLTSMMRRQLDDIRAWGEPLAMLMASEPVIYGRFGYGAAAGLIRADIDTARVQLELPEGTESVRIRKIPAKDALAECEPVYARQVPVRPGMIVRLPGWDRLQYLDAPEDRQGTSHLQTVLSERDGRTTGYALFRIRPGWEDAGPKGRVEIQDIQADDPASYAALCRYVLSIDLTSVVSMSNRPVDDPWQNLISDIRRCNVRVQDSLHVRLVEVGAALEARTYRTPVDVVLEVADAFCPWNEGRWRLTGDAKGASCERTSDTADLSLSVRDLGAVYLGGSSLAELAAAGRVRELRRGALAEASVAFGSDTAPWGPHDI
ncbi:GNAT family N-acetyltransferase [Streptomyces katsurahamanus]|uniref:GNAT family N-acetyltransferase n=1 Tax=Streptomyces katsurahamanus TaxID=2577098 RepID=A0ABW9NTC7_9ACTN|nr:GNAT family N-acetyltransferase [Streptomyces katsurahamanus]MQS36572.1 GNAT family N-acetyltransferase [Streptomyces katsurahamanus]